MNLYTFRKVEDKDIHDVESDVEETAVRIKNI